MENYNLYLKKFKIAISILAVTLVVLIALVAQTVPKVQKIIEIQDSYKTQTSALADAERKLEAVKADAEKKEAENEDIMKMFFKPISDGLDTEAAISDEFGEILQVIRDNKIKARSVKYDYDPQDDNFVKNVGSKYHVCRVTAEMIANYGNFAGFLRELYKHEHFLDISSVEITPYQKNKRILLVSFQFKLYAQKDAATAAAEAAEQATQAQADNANATTPPAPQPADGGKSPEAD